VYALRLAQGHGVVVIPPQGMVRMFARLSAPGLIDGIAFDETGRLGYRLLVTVEHGATFATLPTGPRSPTARVTSRSCRDDAALHTAGAVHAGGGAICWVISPHSAIRRDRACPHAPPQ
jgi:hypothetical protein